MKQVGKKCRCALTGVLLLAAAILSQAKEAKAAPVSVVQGDAVYYEGYSTHYFYIDGALGYCLEPAKSPADTGDYEAEVIGNGELLSKAMYYMYGGPGYEQKMRPKLAAKWQQESNAYCLSHCVLSYVYDNCSGGSDAFIGLSQDMLDQVVQCVEWIRQFPAIPAPDISFSKSELTASFSPGERVQRTEEFDCVGEGANSIEIPLPTGVTLVNVTRNTKTTGKVPVWGGDRFYLTADVTAYNGASFHTGPLYGKNRQAWRTLVVQTTEGSQSVGGGSLITVQTAPASFGVSWIPKPEIQVEKQADKTSKVYKVGDLVTYTIDITQRIQYAVAKNLIISDTILTEGVKLQKKSIVLLDEHQRIVSDAIITVEGNTYTIQAGNSLEFLQSVETGEKFTVEYQVVITEEELIGKEIENEIVIRSDNTEEERDKEVVTVETPEEEKPKEPEPPKVEEPKPEEEKPVPPKQEVQVKPVEKAVVVKTGDVQNLTLLIVLLILSCAAIFICVRIARKNK